MPKVPVDYSKTIIYKLVHFDDLNDENIYVGHCTNMTQRRHNHKKACCNPDNKEHNHYKYQFIRENGGWDQWQMILIEKYPCDDVDQARSRERYWKRELNATLNTYEPGRTKKEYYQDNLNKVLENAKQYRKNNKEEIAEKDKERYENNKHKLAEKITCNCGSIIRSSDIRRHEKSKKHQEWVKNNNVT
jgi:hypothetical protein